MNTKDTRPLHERWRDPNGTLGEVFVVAHRGCFLEDARVMLAENSVPAVKRAVEIGIDMVEVDVRFTSDGTAVVIHDSDLDRTTAGSGPVDQQRYSDIKDIPLVHPSTREPLGATIPTLEEVLIALDDRVMINVELKTGMSAIPDVARIAAEAGAIHLVTAKTNLPQQDGFGQAAEFLAASKHPIDLIPVVIDSRDGLSGLDTALKTLSPSCVECVVDYDFGPDDGYGLLARRGMTMDGGPLFSIEGRRLAAEYNARLFVNTLYVNPLLPGNHQWNGGRSCELGRVAPDSVYGFWIAHGATVIQSDDAPFVLDWLEKSGFRE